MTNKLVYTELQSNKACLGLQDIFDNMQARRTHTCIYIAFHKLRSRDEPARFEIMSNVIQYPTRLVVVQLSALDLMERDLQTDDKLVMTSTLHKVGHRQYVYHLHITSPSI